MRARFRVCAAFAALLAAMAPAGATDTKPSSGEALPAQPAAESSAKAEALAAPGSEPKSESRAEAKPDAPATAKKSPPKPEITLHVDIDLSAQRMKVTAGGTGQHVWPISSGRQGYPTPTGSFKPQWRARMWYSRQWDDAPMPHAIFFQNGVAIHGTYETRRLGRPASHGCVRLAPAHAATLYALVGKHGMGSTRIVVHGAPRFDGNAVAFNDDEPRRPRDGDFSRYGLGYGPFPRPYRGGRRFVEVDPYDGFAPFPFAYPPWGRGRRSGPFGHPGWW
jgi:lipoprotein-anchoring transpeptidase ErfK/SrfK